MPNLKELISIVELACYRPAIDLTAFPNAPSSVFWSSSPVASYSYYAWLVYFAYGGGYYGYRYNGGAVRLVRGGQVLSFVNDTGIDWGADYLSGNNVDCSSNIAAPQDCHQGRDATDDDDTDGHAGFRFVALDQDGQATTPITGINPHACVEDQVTGLTWEVKTDDDGLHDKDDLYTWYNPDPNTNGGAVGYADEGGAICFGYQTGDAATYCNTHAYVQRVNAVGWCGYQDWRLPTHEELHSIVDYSRYDPAIDVDYFPNTPSSYFWSSSPYFYNGSVAWIVNFYDGYGYGDYRNNGYAVRLVRGGQALPSYSLTVSKTGSGNGTVTSNPAGIDCGNDCTEEYSLDTEVTLTATADGNSSFDGWTEGCSGSEPSCTVVMTAAKNVTAAFSSDACTDWGCEAYGLLLQSADDLTLLRDYRDTVLRQDVKGAAWVEQLYGHSQTALEVLLEHPALIDEAAQLIALHRQAVADVLDGQVGVIDDSDAVIQFLTQYAAKSPRGLKGLMWTIVNAMKEHQQAGELFFGFSLE